MTQHALTEDRSTLSEDCRAIGLDGEAPKVLAFSDGTALEIDEESGAWHYGDEEVSVADAISLAGEDNADYVKTRTRCEVAWLWVLAEWCQERAERLARDLDGLAAAR
ncbi:MAG: hypothetical protein QOG09_1188 [Solirubrobacterales bacterium]|jgi:hypothetical protein|nr:hypothetical protein [Solirubrobacterales bacterium]